MLKKISSRRIGLGPIALVLGSAAFAVSALWLLWTGDTGVRYSADHGETVPMWVRWIPALMGIALIRLVPPEIPQVAPRTRTLRVEAGVLLAVALVFATSLRLADGGEPAHSLLKLPLLLGVPAAMFWMLRRDQAIPTSRREPIAGSRFAPVIPVGVWLLLSYCGPLATPSSDSVVRDSLGTLLVTIAVGFLINAVLGEVFYRRWLQTRLESLLGRWPAIVLASLLWAAWHIGIGRTGAVPVDLAHAIVNQGVTGLFLGYLWSKYRAMWPLLVVHAAINALPLLLPG